MTARAVANGERVIDAAWSPRERSVVAHVGSGYTYSLGIFRYAFR